MILRRVARVTGLLVVVAVVAALAVVTLRAGPAPAAGEPLATVTDGCVRSVPEPGSQQPVEVCYTLFRPPGSSATTPVPLVVHAPGWDQPRLRTLGEVVRFTDAGYGVLSYDHRGFGDSTGTPHLQDPAFEGRDVEALVSLASRLAWVEQDGPGDPRLAMVGLSYGGLAQWLAAYDETLRLGRTRVDALVPEETWYDPAEALAPDGVVRSPWIASLTGEGPTASTLAPPLARAMTLGAEEGTWPAPDRQTADLPAMLARRYPAAGAERGVRLDLPVLVGQGMGDSLFGPEQAMATWAKALSPASRARSMVVGYQGGHVLSGGAPDSEVVADPCSRELAGGDFVALVLRFLDEQLRGERTGLTGYGALHLAAGPERCLSVTATDPTRTVPVGSISTAGAGDNAVAYPVAEGPLVLAGTPYLSARVVAPRGGLALYGLAVGTSPTDARLVDGLMLPLRVSGAESGSQVRVPLPGVAVEVPRGSRLYLFAAARSDVLGGPAGGVVTLEDTAAELPVRGG